MELLPLKQGVMTGLISGLILMSITSMTMLQALKRKFLARLALHMPMQLKEASWGIGEFT